MSDRGFGWLRDPPDFRDYSYGPSTATLAALPAVVDLRTWRSPQAKFATPKILDQGQLGSCTVNCTNSMIQYVERLHDDPDQDKLSRLWLYWYMREKMGTVEEDSGGYLRDALDIAAKRGVPRETYWPYIIEKFRQAPTAGTVSAQHHRVLEYRSVSDTSERDMQACLAEGYPFVFGFAVYESFWQIDTDGWWTGERGGIDGYHAVACWGYDFRDTNPARQHWIIRNSWGTGWGDGGYFYVPRAWLPLEAFDCWTVRRVTRDPVAI